MYFISNTYTNVTVSIYGSWVVLNLFTCKFLCQPKNILKYVMHLLYEKKAYTVMVNNFTYINNTDNHLSPELIKHEKDHDKGRPGPGMGQTWKWGGAQPDAGIPTLG